MGGRSWSDLGGKMGEPRGRRRLDAQCFWMAPVAGISGLPLLLYTFRNPGAYPHVLVLVFVRGLQCLFHGVATACHPADRFITTKLRELVRGVCQGQKCRWHVTFSLLHPRREVDKRQGSKESSTNYICASLCASLKLSRHSLRCPSQIPATLYAHQTRPAQKEENAWLRFGPTCSHVCSPHALHQQP